MKTGIRPSAATNADSPIQSDFLEDARLKRIIAEEVRFLLKTGLFPADEKDDLAQELYVAVWQAREKHNPTQSNRYTFAKTIVFKRGQNLIDSALRKKNNSAETISTDTVINEDGDAFHEFISLEETEILEGKRTRSKQDFSELRESLNYAMSLLPDESKKICMAILDGETISSLSRKYGVSRTAFRERYLKPIRSVFSAAGMRDFC